MLRKILISHSFILRKDLIWKKSKVFLLFQGDGHTWISFSGSIKVDENVQITGFKAGGLSVKVRIDSELNGWNLNQSLGLSTIYNHAPRPNEEFFLGTPRGNSCPFDDRSLGAQWGKERLEARIDTWIRYSSGWYVDFRQLNCYLEVAHWRFLSFFCGTPIW